MTGRRADGFTLIEVIAAFLIFALGVLMVIQLSGALSEQMMYAARTSNIVVLAHERLDSLESLPFDSLSPGTAADVVSVEGLPYDRIATVSSVTGVLFRIDVTLSPANGASGPAYAATSYSAMPW